MGSVAGEVKGLEEKCVAASTGSTTGLCWFCNGLGVDGEAVGVKGLKGLAGARAVSGFWPPASCVENGLPLGSSGICELCTAGRGRTSSAAAFFASLGRGGSR